MIRLNEKSKKLRVTMNNKANKIKILNIKLEIHELLPRENFYDFTVVNFLINATLIHFAINIK